MTTISAGRTQRFDPRWLPLVVTTVGSFMSILDSTIVNIALPTILKDFGSTLQSGQFVITSYLMALAVVIPLTGFLGERVGMKKLYIFTLAFFTIGSALCGFAWNMPSLIFFRVVQGLGGGMLMPLGMAIVFTMITPLERPHFMALLGIPALLAPMLGPTLGGYLVEYSSWRTVFLLNVPIGIVDIGLAIILLKETPIRADTRMDWPGFLWAALAFPVILLALSTGADIGWSSPLVLVLFIVGGAAAFAFIRAELRSSDPMLQIRLFAIPMFRLAMFIQWIGFFTLFGLNYIVPLFLQDAHGLGAAEAGQVLLPMGLVAFITMNVGAKLYHPLGPKPLVVTGLLILTLTALAWTVIDENTSLVIVMLVVCGRGLGLGLFGQTVQLVAYNAIPSQEIPRATALVNMGQRIDGALSAAVLTTVLVVALSLSSAPVGSSITEGTAPIKDTLAAFHAGYFGMAVLSVVGIVLAFFVRDRVLEESRKPAAHPAEAKLGREPAAAGGE